MTLQSTRQSRLPHADQRATLLDVALRLLEDGGPEALQARTLTAEVGTSTQAVYTLFGGMPGLFEAIVAEGFVRFGRQVAAVAETDDTVADHFSKGWVYCDWALSHPQLYRLMFGLTGGGLRLHTGLEMTLAGTLANFPEGQAALEVLVRSVDRMKASGRMRPVDSLVAAGQFLSITHGFVLLEIAGTFGHEGLGLQVFGQVAINLMVGLGDSRDAVERSVLATVAARHGAFR
ncbi:MAG: TetR/AcrR family transcriptional regulator [Actinomycetota bacterium]|nr:TetR/AcrR family transcriptional regulator [Actinomycetota bacterium]